MVGREVGSSVGDGLSAYGDRVCVVVSRDVLEVVLYVCVGLFRGGFTIFLVVCAVGVACGVVVVLQGSGGVTCGWEMSL